MTRRFLALPAAVLSVSLCLAAPAGQDAVSVTGTWSLSGWTLRDAVQLRLSYKKASTRWEWSSSQDRADLKGLDKQQLRSMSTPAEFTLERDPGVFFFTGTFTFGLGKGDFRFVPSPTFAAKLVALGYEDVDADNASLMFMAVRDVSLEYAAEVKRLGLARMSVRDLERFLDHGIDVAYVRQLVATGYPGLTAEDVVRLKDHGIDGAYVARIQASAFKDITVDQIVRLHDHGVD